MQYWLFKSEPGAWSWDDQVNKGADIDAVIEALLARPLRAEAD